MSIADAIPKFNIVCDDFDANGCGKYIRMQAKVPLSVVYIAMGSILANICGYQKIAKTKTIKKDSSINQPGRKSISIIPMIMYIYLQRNCIISQQQIQIDRQHRVMMLVLIMPLPTAMKEMQKVMVFYGPSQRYPPLMERKMILTL